MSFDIPPLHIPDNSPEAKAIQAIINRDNVTPEEAVRSVLRGMASKADAVHKPKAVRRSSKKSSTMGDQEFQEFTALYPELQLLDDVTDEQWEGVLKVAREMNKEGFPKRE